jgi:hypothetical protein
MNRRNFLTVMGGATAASVLKINPVFAASTTSFYVKGLVMVSFEDPKVLRLGFPKAPGHKATLAVVPQNGERNVQTIKGKWSLETSALSLTQPKIVIPELVRMKEFYGDGIRSTIENCPTVISIPYSAIQNIAAHELSEARYTFLRADNKQEVNTFRPRRIAESIKIDLSSEGVLKLDQGKTTIALQSVRELHAEQLPEATTASVGDPFADHFHHYFHYLERPAAADFDVVPKKLSAASSTTPRVGNNFMFFPFDFCYMVAIP